MLSGNYFYRRHVCGLSVEETMRLTGRSRATVRRWDRGGLMPESIKKLMAFYAGLNMPGDHPAWKGWRIRKEFIITPEDEWISARDLKQAIRLLNQSRFDGNHIS